MDDDKKLLEENESIIPEENITDQEEDFTTETMKVRKTLRFRVPIVISAVFIFFILRLFDPNIDFNNVNAPLFLFICTGVVVFGLIIYLIDSQTKSIEYSKRVTFRRYKILNEVFDIVSVVPYLAVVMTIVNIFFVSLSPITGTSMEPSFSDNEAVVFSHMSNEYERFDVVIVYEDSVTNPYLIKRVIGLPGEIVRIGNNDIYINGDLLVQDFIDHNEVVTYCTNANIDEYGEYIDASNCTFTVPDGYYFVMGDNRDGNAVDPASGYSIDSRYFGPVEVDNIYGKVVWKFKDYNLIN